MVYPRFLHWVPDQSLGENDTGEHLSTPKKEADSSYRDVDCYCFDLDVSVIYPNARYPYKTLNTKEVRKTLGWSVQINDPESEIWDCELEQIVRELPDCWRKFIPKGETMSRPYGYPAYGNISHPTKKGIEISGSYITTTPDDVENFLFHIMKELVSYQHTSLEMTNNRNPDLFHLDTVITSIEKRLEDEKDEGKTDESDSGSSEKE